MSESPTRPFDVGAEVECRLRLRILQDRGAPVPIRNLEVAGVLTFDHVALVVDPILAIAFSDIARFRCDGEKALLQGVADGRVLQLEFEAGADQDPELWERFCVMLLLRVSGVSSPGHPFLRGFSRDSVRAHGTASIQALDELLAESPKNRVARVWKARLQLGLEKNLAALELLKPVELRQSPEGRMVAGLAALQAERPSLAAALINPDRSLEERLLQRWIDLRGRLDEVASPSGRPDVSIFLPMLRRSGGILAERAWPASEQRLSGLEGALFEGWTAWVTELGRNGDAGPCAEGDAALERYRRCPGADPIEVIRLESALALIAGQTDQAWNLLKMAAVPEFFHGRAILGLRLGKETETLQTPPAAIPASPTGDELWLLAALHLGAGDPEVARSLLEKTAVEECSDLLVGKLLCGEIALSAGEVERAQGFLDAARDLIDDRPSWMSDSLFRTRLGILAAGIRLKSGRPQDALVELARASVSAEKIGAGGLVGTLDRLRDAARGHLERDEAGSGDLSGHQILGAIDRLFRRIDRAPLPAELRARARALVEDARQPLLIAVMGECKAGKSTLMNAFFGDDLLPTGSVPTTAIPWVLKPGSQEVALVHGRDGRVAVASPRTLGDELARLDFEPTRIEAFLPALRMKDMALVDTPGLNSLYEAHQDASEDFLEHADGILWVFDATQIGRRSEREILRNLLPKACPVILAVNRIDEIDADEAPEVIAQAVELAGPGLGRGRAIGVSGRLARAAQKANDDEALRRSGFHELQIRLSEELGMRSWKVKSGRLAERARGLMKIVRERQDADRAGIGELLTRGESLREKSLGMVSEWRSTFAPVIREWVRRNDLKETPEAAFRRETQEWAGIRFCQVVANGGNQELGEVRRRVERWLKSWATEYLGYWNAVAEAAADRAVSSAIGRQSGAFSEAVKGFLELLKEKPGTETMHRLASTLKDLSDRLETGTARALEHLAATRVSRELLWFGPILELEPCFGGEPREPDLERTSG